MENSREKLNRLLEVEAPVHLRENILSKIADLESRKQRRNVWALRLATVASFALCGVSVAVFARELAMSEFWSIARLVVTDMRDVSVYWQDYVFSLLETMPALEMALILAPMVMGLTLLGSYFSKASAMAHGSQTRWVIS